MPIPLVYFLYFYGGLLALFLLFAVFNLYHLFRFGFTSVRAVMMIFIFISGVVVLLYLAYYFIQQIDWSAQLTLLNLESGWPT